MWAIPSELQNKNNNWISNKINYYLKYICSNQISAININISFININIYFEKIELTENVVEWKFWSVKDLFMITYFITNYFSTHYVHSYLISCFHDQCSDIIGYIPLYVSYVIKQRPKIYVYIFVIKYFLVEK